LLSEGKSGKDEDIISFYLVASAKVDKLSKTHKTKGSDAVERHPTARVLRFVESTSTFSNMQHIIHMPHTSIPIKISEFNIRVVTRLGIIKMRRKHKKFYWMGCEYHGDRLFD